MSINHNENQKSRITIDHRILAKNSFYSFLNSYGAFFFSIITSFLLARLITQELWGFLILAFSYITIITLILSFLPPGLDATLNFYIPRFLALKDNKNLKSFIKYAVYLKLLFLIPLFFISLFIFSFFAELFSISLKEYTNLLIILAPFIIVLSLNRILASINRGLNMFNVLFVLLLIRYSFNIVALIFCLFFLNPLKVEIVALIDLFSISIPFLISCIIIIIKYIKIKTDENEKETFKSFMKKTLYYGGPIRLGRFFSEIWNEIQTQSLGTFASTDLVTGLKISKNYTGVSSNMALTFSNPLIISFSSLNAKKNYYQINKLYNLILIYSLLLLTFITGILFFCSDFFLFFIYGKSYLTYSNILKLMLFTIVFLGVGTPFEALIVSTDRVKIMVIYRFFAFLIRLPIFLVVLINFGLLWAIFAIIISNFIIAIIAIILSIKIANIKLELRKLLSLFIVFFLALTLTLALEIIIIDKINYFILQKLNLLFFKELNVLSLLLYVIIYIILFFIFRIFTIKDIEYMEAYFNKEKKFHLIIRKVTKLLKKLLRA